MNGFWMDGSRWEYVVVAISFCVFFLYFWCMGSWYEVVGKHNRDIPKFIHSMFFADKEPMEKKYNETTAEVTIAIWIVRGVPLVIGIGFFLGFQLHLWINYIGDHVTFERALLAQLTMFLPFLLFNYLGAYFFRHYLDKLPERKGQPIE
ncbi:hypothetical protein ACFLW2_02785 [Chloroflexota bacterium]